MTTDREKARHAPGERMNENADSLDDCGNTNSLGVMQRYFEQNVIRGIILFFVRK